MAHLFFIEIIREIQLFCTISGMAVVASETASYVRAYARALGVLPKVLRSVAIYVVSMVFTRVGGAHLNANQHQIVSKVV